jgi:acyl-CoA synthetase (AMP-forming)/AMP-acid ligase II
MSASTERRHINGWSIRWDGARAQRARATGLWLDETIGDAARRLAAKDPDRELVIDGVRRLTAARMLAEAECLAAGFRARGLVPGDVVSFMLPNWHEACVIYLGATLEGLVVHPMVPAFREAEVGFQLHDTQSRILFLPAIFRNFDYLSMLRTVRSGLEPPPEVVVLRGHAAEFTAYESFLKHESVGPAQPVDPDSVRMVLYTSGTTGRPKGVLHTHNSLAADIVQMCNSWGIGANDCFFVPSPVSHIGGSLYAFEMPLLRGTRAVLLDVWDPGVALDLLAKERCTHTAGATTFLQQTLAAAKNAGKKLPDLRVYICGGASVPPSLIRQSAEWFAGCTVSRVYGSTEVPTVTVGSMKEGGIFHAAETDGEVGIAEVKLIGSDRQVVGAGGEGEVLARGPQMMVGYLREEDEKDAFDAEGFFLMGDLARRVDGDYLVITGRKKDIIIRQGENISPKEVEDLLVLHPGIADVAVIGLPDDRTGERACAVIVRAGGAADITLSDLKEFLDARRVARFKIPEQILLRPTLPRNAAGKVMKHLLRAQIMAEIGAPRGP